MVQLTAHRSCHRFLNQIHHTELRDKVIKGTPSSIFQILAEPSIEVEARNSESRLKYDIKWRKAVSINVIKVLELRYLKFKQTFIVSKSYLYSQIIAGMTIQGKTILIWL